MLDPTDPTLVLLSEARRKLAHGRGRGQMRRYAQKGSKNILTGQRVILETVHLPGGLATSPAAWERFLRGLNGRGDGAGVTCPTPKHPSPLSARNDNA